MNIQNIIEILKQAPRIGTENDDPEGNRYIQISETLLNKIIECLEQYALNPLTTDKIVHYLYLSPINARMNTIDDFSEVLPLTEIEHEYTKTS